mgnify:CR=1 FL=1
MALRSGGLWPTYALTNEVEYRAHETEEEERLFHFSGGLLARHLVDAGA